jgi:YHS domain-containing protein
MAQVKDPVCGMDVAPSSAAGKSSYGSQTYYFCSKGCRSKFEADPQKYAGAAPGPAAGGRPPEAMERHEPPRTTSGVFTAPKFGSAGSGGAELEPLPEAHEEDSDSK